MTDAMTPCPVRGKRDGRYDEVVEAAASTTLFLQDYLSCAISIQ